MNKTVGVITLGNSINYGGVLQAAAMSYILKELNKNPIFITHQKMEDVWYSPIRHVKLCKHFHTKKGIITKIKLWGNFCKALIANVHILERRKKIQRFQNFISKTMQTTPYYKTENELKQYCGDFDYYITGSDQVWNSQLDNNQIDPNYFLSFVKSEKRKFSYAASSGGYKSDAYVKKIIELTKDFSGISVRERSLEKQMKRLGREQVETVVDPTLLLSQKDWIQMEQSCDIPEHFILVYYLEISRQMDSLVTKAAKQYGLPVIDILPGFSKLTGNVQKKKTVGPSEFIYLFHHADYIITNSFHGTVFSLLFQKPFLTVTRIGQESRMVDLLTEIGLSNHLADNDNISALEREIPYNKVNLIIKEKREHSLQFLRKMLEMEN